LSDQTKSYSACDDFLEARIAARIGLIETPGGWPVVVGLRTPHRLREVLQPLALYVICVYDEAGNVIETHEQVGGFKEP
jgi:hypothetical protein